MENKSENAKCEEIMNQYLMLDKGEKVPFSLTLHILGCKKCRQQIKMLKMAEEKISAPLKIQAPVTDASIQKVISEVTPVIKDRFYKPLPVAGWIIGGLAMVALLVFAIYYTSDFHIRSLSVSYALTFAFCVIIYCGMFVFSHIDAFVKKISTVVDSL